MCRFVYLRKLLQYGKGLEEIICEDMNFDGIVVGWYEVRIQLDGFLVIGSSLFVFLQDQVTVGSLGMGDKIFFQKQCFGKTLYGSFIVLLFVGDGAALHPVDGFFLV